MLTEGTVDTSSAPRMPIPTTSAPVAQPAQAAHRSPARNPFREAAEELQRASIGALDLLKSLTPKADEHPAPRIDEPAVRPTRTAHGDLFDDEADGELEIPSFLRKKKVS